MTTIQDIARLSGHSPSTVSRALNNSGYVSANTKEKIMKIVREMDYVPSNLAREFSVGRTKRLGVIVPYANHPYFQKLVDHIISSAFERNFEVVLLPTNYNKKIEMKYLESLRSKSYVGLIFTSRSNSFETIQTFTKYAPVVCCEYTDDFQISCAYTDREASYIEALLRLRDQGCNHIGILVSRNERSSKSAQSVLKAYRKVFSKELDRHLLFTDSQTPKDGFAAAKQFLAYDPNLDAIFANNDEIAGGVYQFVNNYGKKTKIKIIGQENLFLSELLGISTVDHHLEQIGERAFYLLFENEITKTKINYSFIER